MRQLSILVLVVALLAAAPAQPVPDREAEPDGILVVDLREADAATRLRVRSLQGLANRTAPTVFVLQSARDEAWLAIAEHWLGRAPETITPDDLLRRVRGQASGQVLCTPSQSYSVAFAATVAGLRGAVLTDRDLGLTTVFDARPLTAGEAADRLARDLAPQADPGGVLLLDRDAELVDLIVGSKWVALTPEFLRAWDAAEATTVAQRYGAGATFVNHPPNPIEGLRAFELAGPFAVRGAASNLSFLRVAATVLPLQQLRPLTARTPGTKYFTVLYMAGQDLGFFLDGMNPVWDAAPLAEIPIGWVIPAAGADLAPLAVQTAMATALTRGTDQFVLDWGAYPLPSTRPATALGAAVRGRQARTGIAAALVRVTDPWQAADVADFCRASGLEGLFVAGPRAPSRGLFAPTTVIPVEPTITDPLLIAGALRRLAAQQDFIALAVDPGTVSPADIRRAALAVGANLRLVGPYELIELQRQALLNINPTPFPEIGLVSATTTVSPAAPGPHDPLTVTVTLATAADLVRVLFQDANGSVFYAPAARVGDNYTAILPPLLPGGEFHLSVQVLSPTATERRSEPTRLVIERNDTDNDGAPDAVERYARTDPRRPDTDGDGLRDGNDRRPRTVDRPALTFLDPVTPPYDRWLLAAAGRSRVEDGGRRVTGDDAWSYHLPKYALAEGATLAMLLRGAVRISLSTDGTTYDTILEEDLGERALRTVPLEVPQGAERAFVRFQARSEGFCELTRFAVLSRTDGPYIAWTRISPPLGVPGLELNVLARAFHPDGLKRVWFAYTTPSGGEIRVPMAEVERTQVYRYPLRDLRDRDWLHYRVIAETTDGRMSASRPLVVPVGRTPLETHTPTALADFTGGWLPHDAWQGQAKMSHGELCIDQVLLELGGETAQPYTLWLLGAPQGRELLVRLNGVELGRVRPTDGAGWHRIGDRSLRGGPLTVEVAAGDQERPGAEAIYAQVLLTRSRVLDPPPGSLLLYYDRLVLFGPEPDTTVSGVITIEASASGNVEFVRLRVNEDELPTSYIRPPYSIEWDSRRAPNGPVTLTVVAYGATRGLPVMEVTTQVIVENERGGR